MFRTILTAALISCSALISFGAGFSMNPGPQQDQRQLKAIYGSWTTIAVEAISVPVFWGQGIEGFLIIEPVFTVEAQELKSLRLPAEPFLISETFYALYIAKSIRFSNLEKHDLSKLKRQIIERVNARLDRKLLIDVAIQRFNYVQRSSV